MALALRYGTGGDLARFDAATPLEVPGGLFLLDPSDPTKKLTFSTSAIGTGATRTITMPDSDVDLANVHALTSSAPADVTKAAAAAGVATTAARADHKHDISTGTPVAIGTSNSEGSSTSLARSGHVHDHGNQTTGAHHAAVSNTTNGFMPAVGASGTLAQSSGTAVTWAALSTISHNSLGDLTTGDPHTQYALLAGRAGGQALIGGTAASENLTLQSTSNATRGQVVVNDPMSVNGNVRLVNAASLQFGDGDNSNYVAFKAATTVSADVTWTLPATDSTGTQYLRSDGSGNLSWGTISAGGDVVGPASATDNALCRFDLTTGKLIQNSSATLDDSGNLAIIGNLSVSANGSSLATPRTIGFVDLSSGEGCRVFFGDSANGWQNGYDQAMSLWSYHTLILMGDRSSGTPPSFETTSNINVLVRNTTAGSPALVVDGVSGQTGNLQQWRNSSGTVLARVDASGNITLSAQADLRLADSDSSNYVGFQAPATVSANVIWTLPPVDGSSGQVLSTNGSGTLSWVLPSTGMADYTFPFAVSDQTDLNFEQNDLVYATCWMPTASMTVSTVKCCVAQTATGNVYAAIYDASLNKLADETTGASCSTTGVKTLTLSTPLVVVAGTIYYVCFRSTANGALFLGTTCTSTNMGTRAPAFIDNNAGASSFPSTITIENRVTRAAWAQMN